MKVTMSTCSKMFIGNIIRPLHTVSPKWSKLSNKAVTIHANTLIEKSRNVLHQGAFESTWIDISQLAILSLLIGVTLAWKMHSLLNFYLNKVTDIATPSHISICKYCQHRLNLSSSVLASSSIGINFQFFNADDIVHMPYESSCELIQLLTIKLLHTQSYDSLSRGCMYALVRKNSFVTDLK